MGISWRSHYREAVPDLDRSERNWLIDDFEAEHRDIRDSVQWPMVTFVGVTLLASSFVSASELVEPGDDVTAFGLPVAMAILGWCCGRFVAFMAHDRNQQKFREFVRDRGERITESREEASSRGPRSG